MYMKLPKMECQCLDNADEDDEDDEDDEGEKEGRGGEISARIMITLCIYEIQQKTCFWSKKRVSSITKPHVNI